MHCIEHGDEVFNGSARLHVVDGVKDESTVAGEDSTALQDLFSHLIWRGKWEHVLSVYAAAPERDAISVSTLQMFRIHSDGGTLHGVQNIETSVDKGWNESFYRAAGMFERLPLRVLMDPAVQLLVIGEIQFAKRLYRTER